MGGIARGARTAERDGDLATAFMAFVRDRLEAARAAQRDATRGGRGRADEGASERANEREPRVQHGGPASGIRIPKTKPGREPCQPSDRPNIQKKNQEKRRDRLLSRRALICNVAFHFMHKCLRFNVVSLVRVNDTYIHTQTRIHTARWHSRTTVRESIIARRNSVYYLVARVASRFGIALRLHRSRLIARPTTL